MRQKLLRLVIAAALVLLGWAAGKAQTSQPSFEIRVNAPGGETTIECVRGCALAWVERGVNSASREMTTFKYGCSADRCSSGRVGGWLK
jgi:hypothetical protein